MKTIKLKIYDKNCKWYFFNHFLFKKTPKIGTIKYDYTDDKYRITMNYFIDRYSSELAEKIYNAFKYVENWHKKNNKS